MVQFTQQCILVNKSRIRNYAVGLCQFCFHPSGHAGRLGDYYLPRKDISAGLTGVLCQLAAEKLKMVGAVDHFICYFSLLSRSSSPDARDTVLPEHFKSVSSVV